MPRVLFLCTGNSARSQMAEIGIDVADAESKHLDRFLGEPWDYVITVCDDAAESCPMFPGGGERLHWSTPDPAAVDGSDTQQQAAFRATRDSLRARVVEFLRTRARMTGAALGARPVTSP